MDIEANCKTISMDTSDSPPSLCLNAVRPKLNLGEPNSSVTEPIIIPVRQGRTTPCSSPLIASSPGATFGHLVPSPIITKRTRSSSQYNRAMENPVDKGKIKHFSRSKGHGFIVSDRTGDDVFLHISDIDGEYVPKEGDEVTYRLCTIPPKNEKFQAVHVQIINFTPDVHFKWETPLDDEERKDMDTSDSPPSLCPNAVRPKLNLGEPKPSVTEPIIIPVRQGRTTPCSSPLISSSPGATFGHLVPSPIITKRTRSSSQYNRAMENPVDKGKIKHFSRSKGHGFIVSERTGDDVFLHISDIDGEYVPKEGDEVTYRLCTIPPKNEKFQAVHAQIINFTPDVHFKWETPLDDEERKE